MVLDRRRAERENGVTQRGFPMVEPTDPPSGEGEKKGMSLSWRLLILAVIYCE